MTIFGCFKNWKKIRALEKEKRELLVQVPADKISRFRELFDQVRNGNANKKTKMELLAIYNSLKELGCREVAEEISAINKKIKALKNE